MNISHMDMAPDLICTCINVSANIKLRVKADCVVRENLSFILTASIRRVGGSSYEMPGGTGEEREPTPMRRM